MFQGFLVAAANDMATVVGKPLTQFHHWSIKTGTQCGGSNCAVIVDNRRAGIPQEAGNLWVVWADNGAGVVTDVWAYVSVDSVVGVRTFLGGAKLVLGSGIGSVAPANVAAPTLLQSGAGNNGALATCPTGFANTCDDTTLVAGVISLLGGSGSGAIGHALTAGMTDIRPEDAKYATNRALGATADTSATGAGCVAATCRSWSLGYGPGPVASKPILSGIGTSTAAATPVQFGLPGYPDPITSITVSTTVQVYPVGEAPIVFVVNRSNTTTGLGQPLTPGDGGYYARNLWDQHPCTGSPKCNSGALPPAPTTRRPLGNLFTGHDCGTANAAFTWPTDTGSRIPAGSPGGQATPIHLFIREPLSGTFNTTEFSEFRIYGTSNGNGAPGNGQPALTSQEQNIDPTVGTGNKVSGLVCATVAGDRTRGIGTGEVINGVGTTGGVLNQADSIAYAFFSFGNVSKLATFNNAGVKTTRPAYGYLMIDGIDPLFQDYTNTVGNPGQDASPTSPLTWGLIPGCATDPANILADCTTLGVWGANLSYPHLRDGTYPAWSELRMLCDTSNTNCTSATDPAGAQALVQNLQFDIHANHVGGVPDFLPFNDADAPAGLTWSKPYGDASFIRQHFTYPVAQTGANGSFAAPTSTHEATAGQVQFGLEPCSGAVAGIGNPVNGPPVSECGGDAGGLIVPTGTAAFAPNAGAFQAGALQ
jgi:hypothetical protein